MCRTGLAQEAWGLVMSFHGLKAVLLACGGIGALLAGMADANAGGFALREQSAYGQGSSYAGVAAGGDLSSMFWNPATMTQVPGIQTEFVATGIFPYASNTPGAGSTLAAFGGTNNTIDNALVPAGYASWQLNPNMWLGLSLNSPFGLSVSFPDLWAGRDYAANDSSIKTYNATPSFAYRINDWISVGVGVQIQYGDASVSRAITPAASEFNLSGDGWGYGFTAGVTVTPTPTTTIGLGYRSAINQKINGTMTLSGPLPGSTPGPVSTTLDLPDVVSLGLRQRVDPQWTLLGTVEWTNWSRIGTSAVVQGNGAPATVLSGFGGGNVTLPFQYEDGWFFSVGAEYQWTDRLAVRGGVAYEKSPITDDVRIPLIPDNDRTWVSVGSTYKISKDLSFDLAYSHAFVKSTTINVVAGNPSWDGFINYAGTISSHFDILSLALKYRWDDEAPSPKKMLYTK
jgi:long-chain fatty acid transport protein